MAANDLERDHRLPNWLPDDLDRPQSIRARSSTSPVTPATSPDGYRGARGAPTRVSIKYRDDLVVAGFWDGGATDWGTAVGTVGLALITTIAVIREGKDRRELKAERDLARARTEQLEQQTAERADRDANEAAQRARRALVDGVTCYVDSVSYDPDTVIISSGDGTAEPGAALECAVIRNLTNAPIRQVEVYWQNAQGDGPVGMVSVVPAGLISVVPPASLRALSRPKSMTGWHRPQVAILVAFTDLNGNRWARRDDGRLYTITATGALGVQET